MRTQPGIPTRIALAGLLSSALLASAADAPAQTGGGVPGSDATSTTRPGKAKLTKKGKAIPPADAPSGVVWAIAAGNRIRKRPYVWGGGHGGWDSWGYDCSGAVSYVLGAAGLLPSPLPSGPLMSWGSPGKGRWITVMANRRHTYAVVAGLRWDTSSRGKRRGGKGPRWRKAKRSPRGFAIRHYPSY